MKPARESRRSRLACWRAVCAVALLLLAAGWCQAQEPQPPDLIEKVQRVPPQSTAQSWAAAEADFRRVLQQDPTNVAACNGLGLALSAAGKWQDARDSFYKVLTLAPSDPEVHFHIGQCQCQLGDYPQATLSLGRYVSENPTNATAHYWLSRAYAGDSRFDEAEASARRAVALQPASAFYHNQLGVCLSRQQRYKEALAAHQQALAAEPTDATALLQLGYCYYQLSSFEKAVTPLEQYLKARPDDFYVNYYLGHARFQLRRYPEAIPPLELAHRVQPDDVLTRIGLVTCYFVTGAHRKAAALFPFAYTFAAGVGGVVYFAGLAGLLVISFRKGRSPSASESAGDPHSMGAPRRAEDCAPYPLDQAGPPVIAEFQAVPPLLPEFAAPKPAAVRVGPGLWFTFGWLGVFTIGNVVWAIVLSWFLHYHKAAALLGSMGATSLPVLLAAGMAFRRKPWGAPFAWPNGLPSVKLVVLGVLGLGGIEVFQIVYTKLVEWLTHHPFPPQITIPLIREALNTNPVLVVVSVVVLAPLAEEVLFRGLLFGALSKWLSARWTILLTAAIFSLNHMQPSFFIPLLIMGMLCGWARHKTGALWLPMLLHIVNNAGALALLHFVPNAP
jgi:tetratricopeptide (TPR) repeat protein/membrane protease YdiL (CAAX protease family)